MIYLMNEINYQKSYDYIIKGNSFGIVFDNSRKTLTISKTTTFSLNSYLIMNLRFFTSSSWVNSPNSGCLPNTGFWPLYTMLSHLRLLVALKTDGPLFGPSSHYRMKGREAALSLTIQWWATLRAISDI